MLAVVDESEAGGEAIAYRRGWLRALGERDRAVPLGQATAPGAEHERDVGVGRHRQVQQLGEVDLARRRREQVVAADDLVDALRRVVDDDGQVVRGDPVVAAEDEVVDEGAGGAGQAIDERDGGHLGAEAQRWPAPVGRNALHPFAVDEHRLLRFDVRTFDKFLRRGAGDGHGGCSLVR